MDREQVQAYRFCWESAELEIKEETSPSERTNYFLTALCSLSCREHCNHCPGVSHML